MEDREEAARLRKGSVQPMSVSPSITSSLWSFPEHPDRQKVLDACGLSGQLGRQYEGDFSEPTVCIPHHQSILEVP